MSHKVIRVFGVTDISRELGLSPSTVAQWRKRYKTLTPQPIAITPSGTFLWDEAGLRKWKKWTERIEQ